MEQRGAGTHRTRASTVAISQLARRGMSRWELEQVLEKREIDAVAVRSELDRLARLGMLDDAALAVSLAYSQRSRRGLGRSAIEAELKKRHIAQGFIDDALCEIADDDEQERATELAVQRIARLASYDDETTARRLNGFLLRKGYSSDIVRRATQAAFVACGRVPVDDGLVSR